MQRSATSLVYGLSNHPPKPQYKDADLLARVSSQLEVLCHRYPDCIVMFTGDLNRLNTVTLEADFGLNQLVNTATHTNNILDNFSISKKDLFSITVVDSNINTKHKALLVDGTDDIQNISNDKSSQTKVIYDIRAPHLMPLKKALSCYNWAHIQIDDDINSKVQFPLHRLPRNFLV